MWMLVASTPAHLGYDGQCSMPTCDAQPCGQIDQKPTLKLALPPSATRVPCPVSHARVLSPANLIVPNRAVNRAQTNRSRCARESRRRSTGNPRLM